jgi:2-polyprenyl-6-methoxyphenol hydroxylase-like FAD-dependent oxidoreductase
VEVTADGSTHDKRQTIVKDSKGRSSVMMHAPGEGQGAGSPVERRASMTLSSKVLAAWLTAERNKPVSAAPVSAAPASAKEAFETFVDGRSIPDIEESFDRLKELSKNAGQSLADCEWPYVAMKALKALPWKAARIWEKLDAQAGRTDYAARPFKGKHVVVVGAGPVGLRFALEARLAGASVTVLEKRGEFVRINRMHLWDWVKQDFILWGAKDFSPPGGSFGVDKDYVHIGISEAQTLLLKCCLLMGVEVELGVEFRSVNSVGGAWLVETHPALQDGRDRLAVDVIACADGAASKIAISNGSNPKKTGLGKEGKAIGIVTNFVNSGTQAERDVRQFSWAYQFQRPLFQRLKAKVGLNLENIVYYRGDENHYMIMTPTKQCLLDTGCLRCAEPDGVPLLDTSNVNVDTLQGLSQQVAEHFGIPQKFTPKQSCMAFDFSDTRRHDHSVIFKREEGAPALPLCLIGDALLEPFWPTGLGCIRGFLGALDAISNLMIWFATGDAEAVLANADTAFNILKSVEGQTKSYTLKPEKEWQVHPSTRYKGFSVPARAAAAG